MGSYLNQLTHELITYFGDSVNHDFCTLQEVRIMCTIQLCVSDDVSILVWVFSVGSSVYIIAINFLLSSVRVVKHKIIGSEYNSFQNFYKKEKLYCDFELLVT